MARTYKTVQRVKHVQPDRVPLLPVVPVQMHLVPPQLAGLELANEKVPLACEVRPGLVDLGARRPDVVYRRLVLDDEGAVLVELAVAVELYVTVLDHAPRGG
jgi:hypothetical protein